jgi:hypothetical protein
MVTPNQRRITSRLIITAMVTTVSLAPSVRMADWDEVFRFLSTRLKKIQK